MLRGRLAPPGISWTWQAHSSFQRRERKPSFLVGLRGFHVLMPINQRLMSSSKRFHIIFVRILASVYRALTGTNSRSLSSSAKRSTRVPRFPERRSQNILFNRITLKEQADIGPFRVRALDWAQFVFVELFGTAILSILTPRLRADLHLEDSNLVGQRVMIGFCAAPRECHIPFRELN